MDKPANAAEQGSHSDTPATPPVTRRRRGFRRLQVIIAVFAAAAFLGLLAFGVLAQSPDTSIDDSLAQGRPAPAPAFVLSILQRGRLGSRLDHRLAPTLANPRLGIRALRGVPVVLNIWASWCDPCKQEAPLLERTWRTVRRQDDVLFLGLDQQDLTSDAHAFMRSYGIDYPNLHDTGNDVPRSYGATGIPETYFISTRGDVVDHVVGTVSPSNLRDGIAAAVSGRLVGVRAGGARRRSR